MPDQISNLESTPKSHPGPRTHPRTRPRRSVWAIAALGCSLVVFCLPLTILGPLFGWRALIQIRTNPHRTGRTMAILAILVGVISTGFWSWGALWWHSQVRTPMIAGPIRAIMAGQSGDVAGFRAGFANDAMTADEEEIRLFLGEISDRYGRLVSIHQRVEDDVETLAYQIQSYRIPYEMVFETGPIKAEAEFILFSPEGKGFVGRFAWLALRDPELGDLVFPASAASESHDPQDADVIGSHGN